MFGYGGWQRRAWHIEKVDYGQIVKKTVVVCTSWMSTHRFAAAQTTL